MNARRFIVPVLAIGCLAGGWAAWRLELQVIALRSQIQGEHHAGLGQRLADVEGTARGLEGQLAQMRSTDKAAPASVSDDRNRSDPPAVDPAERHRALAAFAKAWMQRSTTPIYQHLARSLALSDSQLAQLSDLNAERMTDAWQAMQPLMGGKPDAVALAQAVAQATAGTETQIRQLLGDSGYAQFQQQVKVAPEEALVAQVNQTLAGTPGQMTDAQQDQLAQILAQNQPVPKGQFPPMAVLNSLSGNGPAQVTDAAVAQAANVLTPDQVAAVQQYQADVQAKQVVGRMIQQSLRQLRQAQSQAGGQ